MCRSRPDRSTGSKTNLRMETTTDTCPFCAPPAARTFYADPLVIGLWDGHPVSPGHALVVPRRHVTSWFEASSSERTALIAAIDRAKAAIERIHAPSGFNIGINIGASAGQTIFHLHVHLIPRYVGDVADPRGGVRYVIPSQANYLLRVEDSPPKLAPSADRLLWTGGKTEPFNQQLMEQFATAARADIAVAFVMKSGVDLLRSAIVEALNRGTHIRLLTGDYLDATDPAALIQLARFRVSGWHDSAACISDALGPKFGLGPSDRLSPEGISFRASRRHRHSIHRQFQSQQVRPDRGDRMELPNRVVT